MGENICGYISEKGELYRTQEELSKSRAKKKKKKKKREEKTPISPIRKWAKGTVRHFTKKMKDRWQSSR